MNGLTDAIGQTLGDVIGSPAVQGAWRLILVYLAILWLACAWWTWRDLRARTSDLISPYLAAAGVLVLTPLLFPLALVVYAVVRPPLTREEQRAADLERTVLEAGASRDRCVHCDSIVDPAWVRCPACGAMLAARCRGCGRMLGLDWTICAWCAAEPSTVPVAAPPAGDWARPTSHAGPDDGGQRPMVPVMAEPVPVDTASGSRPSAEGDGPAVVALATRAALAGVRRAEAAVTVDADAVPWADDDPGDPGAPAS